MQLWVLLFNIDAENQGIYTLLMGGKNTVIAFEAEDDAIRCGGLLEAQDFPSLAIESIDESELTEFCQEANYDLTIVSEGELFVPPTQNVEKLDIEVEADEESSYADDEIEAMRRRLEGLL